MENAKIAYFEDQESLRRIVTIFLRDAGHEVLHAIDTMEKARALIAELEPESIDVAIVDGNLGSGSTGEDGKEIVRLLRERLGNSVVVIGSSGSDDVAGADYQASKGGNVVQTIPSIIKDL